MRRVITGNQIQSSVNHLNGNLADSGKTERYVVSDILGVDMYKLWMCTNEKHSDWQKIIDADSRSIYNILATLRRVNDVRDGVNISEGLYVRQEAA